MFTSILGLYPLDAMSNCPPPHTHNKDNQNISRQRQMFPGGQKCPPVEDHWPKGLVFAACRLIFQARLDFLIAEVGRGHPGSTREQVPVHRCFSAGATAADVPLAKAGHVVKPGPMWAGTTQGCGRGTLPKPITPAEATGICSPRQQ